MNQDTAIERESLEELGHLTPDELLAQYWRALPDGNPLRPAVSAFQSSI